MNETTTLLMNSDATARVNDCVGCCLRPRTGHVTGYGASSRNAQVGEDQGTRHGTPSCHRVFPSPQMAQVTS